MVACHTVNARLGQTLAAKNVATADYYPYLDTFGDDIAYLAGNPPDHLRIDAVIHPAHQGLAAELEENSLVLLAWI
jgi:hypothetical protein